MAVYNPKKSANTADQVSDQIMSANAPGNPAGSQKSVRIVSAQGILASLRPPQPPQAAVAPTTSDDTNTIALDLIPIACVSMHDALFEFDSSFVTPEAAKILQQIPDLREGHKNSKGEPPLLSIYGHADPVGEDAYNKVLSGRRAKAVYGLLTHKTGIWESLFNAPAGGDDWHNANVLGTIRNNVPGSAGMSRKDLFAAYMAAICPVQLQPADFLGQGGDPGGKADFQGCSSFNPLLILSEDESATLSHELRNLENRPNRRVVIYFYDASRKVNPALWPCPRASEGPAGCHERFFADAGERRAAGPDRREHIDAQDITPDSPLDTFACRFYSRTAAASPCERVMRTYRLRLFDAAAQPLPFAPCAVSDGEGVHTARADKNAFVTIDDVKVPSTCTVRWSPAKPGEGADSPPPDPDARFLFQEDVILDVDDGSEQGALQQLQNLGYTAGPDTKDDVAAFQHDYQSRFPELPQDGTLDAATRNAINRVHEDCDPSRKSDREPLDA